MNYQYRHGTSLTTATKTLYAEGGIRRFYQGTGWALIQGPVSRFGDTAANAGILALLQSNSYLSQLPTVIQTIFASLWSACPHSPNIYTIPPLPETSCVKWSRD